MLMPCDADPKDVLEPIDGTCQYLCEHRPIARHLIPAAKLGGLTGDLVLVSRPK